MKTSTKLAAVTLAGALAAVAHAAPINIDGVILDPDAPLDLNGTTATVVQNIDPNTGILSGFGVITTINGTGVAAFCPGCELTLAFGGYTPTGGAIPTLNGGQIAYSGGFVNLYVDTSPDADPFNPLALTLANTTDGDLWAGLIGHAVNGITFIGPSSLGAFGNPVLSGQGVLDITSGAALAYINTNTQADGSDISFVAGFTQFPTNSLLFATGSGNFSGDTVAVPEPISLSLVGLGLLGIVGFSRRSLRG